MEELPNFIRSIEYLCSSNKNTYAVALYMLSYIYDDDIDNMLSGAINYIPTEIYDDIISMELYHIKKKIPWCLKDYTEFYWSGKPNIQEATDEYANNIYSIIDSFKKNGLTIDFFDGLEYCEILEDNTPEHNTPEHKELNDFDSDYWNDLRHEFHFEEIVRKLETLIN